MMTDDELIEQNLRFSYQPISPYPPMQNSDNYFQIKMIVSIPKGEYCEGCLYLRVFNECVILMDGSKCILPMCSCGLFNSPVFEETCKLPCGSIVDTCSKCLPCRVKTKEAENGLKQD
jgi:hypothetical protein